MGTRRQARELALQFLFQMEFNQGQSLPENLTLFRKASHATTEAWSYMEEVIEGLTRFREQIDSHLARASAQWKVDRMSPIDRNIMRIATYEMLFSAQPIPPTIAINEAVEIARRFGGTDSAGFVNGVLDQISRTCGNV